MEQRVLVPLNTLMELFEGPVILVQKRHDKLLDYDGLFAKAEKNKDNRTVSELNQVLMHKHWFIYLIFMVPCIMI